jgi:hypothetical protein
MKRFLLMGLLLIGSQAVTYAQTDDIYADGPSQRERKHKNKKGSDDNNYYQEQQSNTDSESAYNDHTPDNYLDYNNPDDYIDYGDDDSYCSRINRFDNAFYNMGYYSTFYNPFWYNRYWYDPYYSWSPWYPSVTVSFGYGPYWSSGWGWSTWWGYSGFGSCWSYPYYACGWYGNYYNNHWNGYYAGIDRHTNYRSVGYGPRQASMGNRMGNRMAANGFRTTARNEIGLRQSALAYANTRGSYNTNTYRNNNTGYRGERAERGSFENNRGQGSRYGQENARHSERNGAFRGFFGNGNRGAQQERSYNNSRSNGNQGRSEGYRGGGRFFNGNSSGASRGFNGGGSRSFNGGGSRSFNGGGGSRSFGGGGGRSSGGGGGRSSGGHSGGGRR